MAAPDDSELVRRAQAGDEDAFQALFERHSDVLSGHLDRWMPSMIQRKVSVADLLQEVRIVAFRRLPEFEDRGGASFRAWLKKIAELRVRKVVQRFAGTAKRAVGREVTRGARPDTAHFRSREPTPSQHAIAAETETLVRRALAALPPDYREILRLAQEERLSLADAAERMGRSREAAKKLYGRALAKFTKVFEGLKHE